MLEFCDRDRYYGRPDSLLLIKKEEVYEEGYQTVERNIYIWIQCIDRGKVVISQCYKQSELSIPWIRLTLS